MFILILIPVVCGLIYRCRNEIKENYEDYKRLKETVISLEPIPTNFSLKTKVINTISIECKSLKMVMKNLLFRLNQYMNGNVKFISRNKIEITYVVNGKTYKLIQTVQRGPNPILKIRDGDKDVTDKVIPYIGPQGDFHGSELTPNHLDCKELVFEYDFGEMKSFDENTVIKLN